MRKSLQILWTRLSLAGAIIAALLSTTQAQTEPEPSADFQSYAGTSLPNAELPPQVVAPEGKLTLFTDFTHASELGCPVYLVNRTGKSLTLPNQDGSLLLKLTYAQKDGTWRRAQSHFYSFCGNSYMFPTQLPAGQHVKTVGYVPTRGNMGKIRYQLFDADEGEMVSNEGSGLWNPQDVADSLNDEMSALQELPEPDAIHEIRSIHLIADPSQRREAVEDAIASLDLIGRGPAHSRLLQGLQSLKILLTPTDDYKKQHFYWPAVLLESEDLDKAMRFGAGWPMGPATLVDLVGIDVHVHASEALWQGLREPRMAAPARLVAMAKAGKLGRKSGEGFYRYDES